MPKIKDFWWGYRIRIKHNELEEYLKAANVATAFVKALSFSGVAAPVTEPLAIALSSSSALLKFLDRGRGVYINILAVPTFMTPFVGFEVISIIVSKQPVLVIPTPR